MDFDVLESFAEKTYLVTFVRLELDRRRLESVEHLALRIVFLNVCATKLELPQSLSVQADTCDFLQLRFHMFGHAGI